LPRTKNYVYEKIYKDFADKRTGAAVYISFSLIVGTDEYPAAARHSQAKGDDYQR
jgi:hypothetical protein